MSVTEHQRPGVYSVYDASSALWGRTGGRAAAVVAVCSKGEAGKVYPLTGYEQAVTLFTAGEAMTGLVKALFANGAAKVYAVPVTAPATGSNGLAGYKAAFAAIEGVEDVAVVACDSTDLTVQQALRDSVKTSSAARRERLALVCGAVGETAAALSERAGGLNCERVVLIAPGGAVHAAAVAGAIAGGEDPALPLGGAELKEVPDLAVGWTDSEIDTLVLGGVTPLEQVGGIVSVVRGITTRTKTGQTADPTWRELSTIRIVDDVIPDLRSALRAKFSRAKNTEQGRGAIRSQVIVVLEGKVRQEIIAGYEDVTVSAVEEDPTVCLVEFKFTVAHGLNQIWLSAHITV